MKRQLLQLALFSLLGFAAGLPAHAQSGVLRVSAIPDEAPTELQRKFKPLGEYLKKKTGMDVQFTPVTDYAAVVEGLADEEDRPGLARRLHLRAGQAAHRRRRPCRSCSAPRTRSSPASFIVPTDSPIKKLADLKGHTFAFGSPSSTSGHLMPRYFLHAGTASMPDKRLQDRRLLRRARRHRGLRRLGPRRGRRAQRLGDGQAGRDGRTRTPPRCACWRPRRRIFDYNWTVRPGLDAALTKKLTDAFLALDPAKPERQGDPRPAARLEVHPDPGGELRRHRRPPASPPA